MLSIFENQFEVDFVFYKAIYIPADTPEVEDQ